MKRAVGVWMLLVAMAGCPGSGPGDSGPGDSGLPSDGGLPPDSGFPPDGGLPPDSGRPDGGLPDGGDLDGGQDAGTLPVERFQTTFRRERAGHCDSPDFDVVGFAPATTGIRYPLFVYNVGSLDNHDGPPNVEILREAAALGFVAVSADYSTNYLLGCDDLTTKAKCLYDPQEPNSAVSRLCSRADVDCELGIVTGGHSQGAQLALVARNFDTRIRAVLGLGATCDYLGEWRAGDNPGLCSLTSSRSCLHKSNTALPRDRLRLVNGLEEVCYSTSARPCGIPSGQGELERLSGAACGFEPMSCLNPNGSGWLIVPNSADSQGAANHLWFWGLNGIDPGFAPPTTDPWSLLTNVLWLKSFTGSSLAPR